MPEVVAETQTVPDGHFGRMTTISTQVSSLDGPVRRTVEGMASTPSPADPDRARRRLQALDALREATELRDRLRPRARHLRQARALLQARTTRG